MNLPVASPTLRKLLEHWLAAVFVVVLFTFGVVADWVFHKRSRAELLLRSITELRLGTSAFTEARELAQEYGGKSQRGGSERGCSAQACTFTFVIDNRPLNYIPGVRGVRFVAAIGVKDGYVTSREVDYAIMNSTDLDFMYTVLDHLESAKGLEVRKLNLDPMGRPHILKVTLGRSATADERQRAFSIQLSCFARLRGCNDAAAVFSSGL
jgi:hypothetical protein